MLSIQYILSLFKSAKAQEIVYFFMCASIIQIVDLFLTIYLTQIFGVYLIMAMICCLSLAGLFISLKRVGRLTDFISRDCNNGVFPEIRFFELTGVFLASILLFIPGFISSLIGFFIILPPLSNMAGRMISSKTSTDWHTVYEYMKI